VSLTTEGLQIILITQVGPDSGTLHPVTRFRAVARTGILRLIMVAGDRTRWLVGNTKLMNAKGFSKLGMRR